jgi:hypothetical protein
MSKPLIGKILEQGVIYNRDAIHVPIMPAIALEELKPGEKIVLKKTGDETFGAAKSTSNSLIGVVDPYLREPVKVGEKFFVWIKPSTVQKLWHEWSHPIFDK